MVVHSMPLPPGQRGTRVHGRNLSVDTISRAQIYPSKNTSACNTGSIMHHYTLTTPDRTREDRVVVEDLLPHYQQPPHEVPRCIVLLTCHTAKLHITTVTDPEVRQHARGCTLTRVYAHIPLYERILCWSANNTPIAGRTGLANLSPPHSHHPPKLPMRACE